MRPQQAFKVFLNGPQLHKYLCRPSCNHPLAVKTAMGALPGPWDEGRAAAMFAGLPLWVSYSTSEGCEGDVVGLAGQGIKGEYMAFCKI